jgi:hypothetical protein
VMVRGGSVAQQYRTDGMNRCGGTGSIREAPSDNKRVPPALTTFAPENTARDASRVGTLERYTKLLPACAVTVRSPHNQLQMGPA